MTDFGVDLQPLAGGMSGETWLTEYAGERAVVRIYGGRSLRRGPRASEVDAAVLAWLAGLLPVPQVLEVRRGDPDADLPAVLVTSYLPGVLLADLKPTLDDAGLTRVGQALGTLLGRLAHVALPRAGLFHDPDLGIDPMPEVMRDLTLWTERAVPDLTGWDEADLVAPALARRGRPGAPRRGGAPHLPGAQRPQPEERARRPRHPRGHGSLDWEFAHAGSPYADLGNLLRLDREPAFADAVLAAREAFVPDPRPDALDLARASDLFALVDLATRREENPVAARADALLHAVARSGHLMPWLA